MDHDFSSDDSSFASESSDSDVSVGKPPDNNVISSRNGKTIAKTSSSNSNEERTRVDKDKTNGPKHLEKIDDSFSDEDTFFDSSSSSEEENLGDGVFVDEKVQTGILALLEKNNNEEDTNSEFPFVDHTSVDTNEKMLNQLFTVDKQVSTTILSNTDNGDNVNVNANVDNLDSGISSPIKDSIDANEKNMNSNVKVSKWLGKETYDEDEYEDDFEDSESINNFHLNQEFDKISATSATDDTEMDRQHAHARRIQSRYRGYQTRSEINPRLKKRTDAAVNLQKTFRGHNARRNHKMEIETKKRKEAATLVQKVYRGHNARQDNSTKKETLTLIVEEKQQPKERKEVIDNNVKQNKKSKNNTHEIGVTKYDNYPEKQDDDAAGYYDENGYYLEDEGDEYYHEGRVSMKELNGMEDDGEGIEAKSSKEDIDTLGNIDNFLSNLSQNGESPKKKLRNRNDPLEEPFVGFDDVLDSETNSALRSLTQSLQLNENNYESHQEVAGTFQKTETVLVVGSLEEKEAERRRRVQGETLKKKEVQDMEKIKNENAVIIQQSYRGHQGRKIAGLKHIENQQKLNVHWKKNFEAMRVKKAIVIQKYVRRHIVLSGSVLRKRKSERRAQRLKRLRKKKEKATIRIQRYSRGYIVRNSKDLARRKRMFKKKREEAEKIRKENASICLQKHYRAYSTRKQRILHLKRAEKRKKASVKIQAFSRGYHIRRQNILNLKRMLRDSAIKVQKLYRGWSIRTGEDLKSRIQKREHERQTYAATKIQSIYRMHRTKVIISKRKFHIIMVQAIIRVVIMRKRYLNVMKKAIVIQCAIRQHLARQEYRRKFQIKAFEDAKRARRIEDLQYKIFLKKVMEEKARQARLLHRPLTKKLRQSPKSIISPVLRKKQVPLTTSRARSRVDRSNSRRTGKILVLRNTANKGNGIVNRPSSVRSSKTRLLPETGYNYSNKSRNTLWSPRQQNGVEKLNTVNPPNISNRQYGVSPRTKRLYRLYTHTYDIR